MNYFNLQEEHKVKNKYGQHYKYLYVGRANDINKRFRIIYDTMMVLGDKTSDLAVLGSENPGFGDYYGILNDQGLNMFYNSVEYFFFPSAFKSIGLPALESVVTKTKTIVCADDPTTDEFWAEIGVSSNPHEIAVKIKDPVWNKLNQDFVNSKSEEYRQRFSGTSIAQNIINLLGE